MGNAHKVPSWARRSLHQPASWYQGRREAYIYQVIIKQQQQKNALLWETTPPLERLSAVGAHCVMMTDLPADGIGMWETEDTCPVMGGRPVTSLKYTCFSFSWDRWGKWVTERDMLSQGLYRGAGTKATPVSSRPHKVFWLPPPTELRLRLPDLVKIQTGYSSHSECQGTSIFIHYGITYNFN